MAKLRASRAPCRVFALSAALRIGETNSAKVASQSGLTKVWFSLAV